MGPSSLRSGRGLRPGRGLLSHNPAPHPDGRQGVHFEVFEVRSFALDYSSTALNDSSTAFDYCS
jgi:hypothetical protein